MGCFKCVVAMVMLLSVAHVKCDDDDDEPKPPNGTVPFPPPMTMDVFRAHVSL